MQVRSGGFAIKLRGCVGPNHRATMTSTVREIRVCVAVYSETHTSRELADALRQVPPDISWNGGEEFTLYRTTRTRQSSRWAVVERAGDIQDWRDTVERLIHRLRPAEEAFRTLPADVVVALEIFLTEDNDVFGFGLDRGQIEFMSKIGAALDMSVVVKRPPRPRGTKHGQRSR